MREVIRVAIGIAALTLLGAGMTWAQVQTDAQQTCINAVNKAAPKVQAAQGKAANGCIKDFVKGVLVGTAEACMLNDPKNKVEAKQQTVLDNETKNCNPMDVPDFAYTSGALAASTAYQADVDLIHDVFGNPIDGGLWDCDTHPAECLCQRQVTGRIEKLFRAMPKIFVKCKKFALAIDHDPFLTGANSIAQIAECITNASIPVSVAADTKTKIATAKQQMLDTINQFCGLAVEDEFVGGMCAGLTGAPLRDCLAQRVTCHFCRMEQAIDAIPGVNLNCATFSGGACP